jgi:Cytochrome c oxidase subunit IV
MKVEARLFLGVAVFLWLAAIGYGIWSAQPNSFSHGNVEPVGVAALILSGGLLGIPGGFFWFVSRRIDPRPEDRSDAEIAEAAGDFGFFSPGSYWPVTLAGAATVMGVALAFVQVWLLIVGIVFLLFAIGGLLFEYYIGGHRPLR